jgi:peroxiredoxin
VRRFSVFLISLFLCAASAQTAWNQKAAPNFELPTLSGKTVSLAALRGKVVFVHFWASWCMPCKEEFPKLNDLAAAYPEDQLKVLGITVDKAQANIERFLKKYVRAPLRAEVLRDPEGRVAEAYQNRAMPITFVLDRQGTIRFMHMGFQKGDEARWRSEVDELLRERAR